MKYTPPFPPMPAPRYEEWDAQRKARMAAARKMFVAEVMDSPARPTLWQRVRRWLRRA